jgi:hypothetical protein
LLVMLHPTQELEPPANPVRFRPPPKQDRAIPNTTCEPIVLL